MMIQFRWKSLAVKLYLKRANKEMNKTENLQKLCYKSQWTCERRISLKTVGTQYTHAS